MQILCEDCRDAFPSTETIVITEKKLAYSRSSRRIYSGVRGGIGIGGGSGETYRYKDRTICLGCAQIRYDDERRARFRRTLLRLVLVGCAVAAFFYIRTLPLSASNSSAENNYALTDDPSADVTAETPVTSEPSEAAESAELPSRMSSVPAERETASQTPIDSPVSSGTIEAPPSGSQIAAASTEARDTERTVEIAEAINAAAAKALARGERVRWHKNGEKGYVVISAEQVYDDRTCRNVIATVIQDEKQVQSSSKMWCKSPSSGDWRMQG